MAILLLVGETWIRRSGRSPEWWDSWVITLWVRHTENRVLRLGLTRHGRALVSMRLVVSRLASNNDSSQYLHGASGFGVVCERHATYVCFYLSDDVCILAYIRPVS